LSEIVGVLPRAVSLWLDLVLAGVINIMGLIKYFL
jgi:hypothetical protein